MPTVRDPLENRLLDISKGLSARELAVRTRALSELLRDEGLRDVVVLSCATLRAVEEAAQTGRQHDPAHLGWLRMISKIPELVGDLAASDDRRVAELATRVALSLNKASAPASKSATGVGEKRPWWQRFFRTLRMPRRK